LNIKLDEHGSDAFMNELDYEIERDTRI
jgi:hypothetical protein